ncbi:two-component response regulator-like APRR2 isoform X8 [Manihot esculenta]|uniref:two-component response regulator-like APRR2 isoform X8 n=1 Tax=Manihot esculenta TaxID=3983 RepID=UPI001CC42986|nr:two-component response regulator-like APRR2 isoform X8 [Manihot esculenta]
MVCTANDLSAWEDFPKGLRILLLEEDSNSAAELKSKLEAMDYIVSIFCNENEALSAISNEPESFHVAIVEVGTSNSNGRFEFLEAAKDLPAIMISNIHCLSIMMKCIALGAVEFLRKPLSEEKLRNIWQHVVRKAFNAGGNVQSESLKPVKDYVASMLQIKVETEEAKNESLERIENGSPAQENEHEQSSGSDKYPAPSTPQLKQGARLLDDGDCQDHTNCSAEKESEGESKSVENTCAMTEVTLQVNHPQSLSETLIKEEDDLADCVKCENNVSNSPQNKGNLNNPDGNAQTPDKASGLHNSYGTRVIRKKMKAVEQLGVDQAIPSRILEVMKVEGLTRHNVASHLQMHAEAWGCPVMPPPQSPYSSSPQNATVFHSDGIVDNGCNGPQNSFDLHPTWLSLVQAEELVDNIVKEAINKPWLPLPLGLKPPSTDSVLAELTRQGISRLPSHINFSNSM